MTVPILGRIRIGKSMVQFNVYVIPNLWDVKSGRAVGKSKPSTAADKEIDRISLDIHSACKDLLAKKENVSALEVKNAFQGISSTLRTKQAIIILKIPQNGKQNNIHMIESSQK